ncbi:MAG: hypothetical protein M3O15_11925, partial [Acidobacteriota bacterium]|nr:hypothetical protein [Acidobacteriota bacterium]
HPTAAQVGAALTGTALDIMGPGPDRDSGAGIVMADRLTRELRLEVAASFFTLPPCRLIDTRNPLSPLGGPILQSGALRTFALAGSCAIPLGARSLSANITVVQPAAAGDLRLFPADSPSTPPTSTINFRAGVTRANNALLTLPLDSTGGIQVQLDSTGPVHLILDVNGYFQ